MHYQKIKHKRNQPGNTTAPVASAFETAEFILNLNSNRVYFKNYASDVVELKAVAAGTSASLTSSSIAPTNPAQGDVWIDSSTIPVVMKYWNGTSWVASSTAAPSATAPTSPTIGQTWFDSSQAPGQMKIWNGTSWVASSTSMPSGTAPTSPVTGQIWWDNSVAPGQLKIWNGSAWISSSTPMPSASQPASPSNGQLWWDNTNKVLKVWNGTAWVETTTPATSATSPSSPTLGQQWFDTATGTLRYWNGSEWVSSEGVDINDTTANATRFPLFASAASGILKDSFVSSTKLTFNPLSGLFSSTGFNSTYYQINSTTVVDTNRNLVNIANATSSSVANTFVLRDASGNFSANVMSGVATQARYADLAEKYLADKEYAHGTVVCIGGEKEVTATKLGDRAIGVVSTNPAYMMNSEQEGGTYIALKGRVPCKVVGSVGKGAALVASGDGCAQMTYDRADPMIFGYALETCTKTNERLIEVLVL